MKKVKEGFTIVELLIVIVIIGILAAITIVSYDGIQNRAYNVAIISNVKSYQDGLAMYLSQHGRYPSIPSEATPGADDRICLGVGYPDNTCGDGNFPSHNYDPFNTDLKTVMSLPVISSKKINMPFSSLPFVGATLVHQDGTESFTVNGVANPYFMQYVLIGANQDCKLKIVEQADGKNWPNEQTTTHTYSYSDGKTTACVVALPNP